MTIPIGKAIRAARLHVGLSQRQLDDKVGFSSNYICRVENGDRTVHLETLDKISKALGVSPVKILRFAYSLQSGETKDVPIYDTDSANPL